MNNPTTQKERGFVAFYSRNNNSKPESLFKGKSHATIEEAIEKAFSSLTIEKLLNDWTTSASLKIYPEYFLPHERTEPVQTERATIEMVLEFLGNQSAKEINMDNIWKMNEHLEQYKEDGIKVFLQLKVAGKVIERKDLN